jgi:hypothetical protein
VTVQYQGTRDVPLEKLGRFPRNPRRGNVTMIRESVRRLTQFRSIVVRDTGTGLIVLAGNHTADAIEAEGMKSARCDIITCTDDEARRIVAADNRTADLGAYDDDLLAELLASLAGDYDGTGWAETDASRILDDELPEEFRSYDESIEDSAPDPPEPPATIICPSCGHSFRLTGK